MDTIDVLEDLIVHLEELDFTMTDILNDGNLMLSKNMQFDMEDLKAYIENTKDKFSYKVKKLYKNLKK